MRRRRPRTSRVRLCSAVRAMGLALDRRPRLMAPTEPKGATMPVIVGVALGGSLGASSRYLLDRLIEQHTESVFPWSTFTINVSGCILIGLITETLVDRHHLPAWLRVGLVVGASGGYTTFSTYSQ